MSKGRLKPEDEASIQQNYVYLKENLEALDLVDYLFQCAVITTHDKEQIYAEKIKKHRNEILLNILLNSGAGDSFEIFLKSLETQYKSVLQRLLGKSGTLKDTSYQGQVDTILKKENDTLLEALAVEKEINIKLNFEIECLTKSVKEIQERNALLQEENAHLKTTQRCLKCRQEDLRKERDSKRHSKSSISQDNTKDKTFIEDTEDTSPEFVCELTGLSKIKCVDKCLHIIGQHEHQITKNGETDLQMCKALCTKNPGHVNFVELDKFGLQHLPDGYKDIQMVEYVKAVAGFVVKVSVTKTSPYRPMFWPDSQIPYPLYDVRGQSDLRTGSGVIYGVEKCSDTVHPFKKCPCYKCKISDEPSKIWWKIYINTVANLVFDYAEARETSVTLFYDYENSPTVTLNKIFDHSLEFKEDSCGLVYVSCDRDKREPLTRLEEMSSYLALVRNKIRVFTQPGNDNNYIFTVSHPHGCCKMVSLGHWNEKYEIGERHCKFTYTASSRALLVANSYSIS
uniref:CARD domain-containing protein n=1 Tax=Biomphalaria glabrata TaxID=6526 RepID=A0A2C9MA20_BIOGL